MLFRLPWQFAVSSDASLVAVLQVSLTQTLLKPKINVADPDPGSDAFFTPGSGSGIIFSGFWLNSLSVGSSFI
jgi:hypothetical protein